MQMTPKFHSLTIKDIRQETDDTVSIAFEIPENLQNDYVFHAGQYLTLKASINGEDVRRSYSLCSAPEEKEWRVAVKKVDQGKFSTFANKQLKSGDVLEVMTPGGSFTLKVPKEKRSLLLFAAGSGITPIISILKSALVGNKDSDVTLIYGNRGFSSIIFREEIEALKNKHMNRLRVLHVLSRENLGNHLQKGRINSEKIEEVYQTYLKDASIDDVFVCGPEEMIHAVKETMINKGVAREHIHFELFTAPSVKDKAIELPKNSPKIEANVTIILDGDEYELELDSTGQSILDAAHAVGADLPFACKGGVCCTCKARIIDGSASMDVNYSLEPDEVAAGYVLTCQAHPTSDSLIISFDE